MSHFSRFFRKNGTFASLQNPQPLASQMLTPTPAKPPLQTVGTFGTFLGQKLSHRCPTPVPTADPEYKRIGRRTSPPPWGWNRVAETPDGRDGKIVKGEISQNQSHRVFFARYPWPCAGVNSYVPFSPCAAGDATRWKGLNCYPGNATRWKGLNCYRPLQSTPPMTFSGYPARLWPLCCPYGSSIKAIFVPFGQASQNTDHAE
jgi:hypothetical protein